MGDNFREYSWLELIGRLEGWNPGELERLEQYSLAWDEIHRRILEFSQFVLAPQLGLSREDAEDVAQTTLLKLQNRIVWRRFTTSRSIDGYVLVIARNEAIDLSRAKTVRRRALQWRTFPTPPREIEDPRLALELTASLEDLRIALAKLSPEDRSLLAMRFWENLSIAEIARKSGLLYATVASRMFRLLHRLREDFPENQRK